MTIGRKLLVALPSIASCLFTVAAVDSWHVEGEPKVIAQDIHFPNGDVRLAGTLYLLEKGEHLPAGIALHGTSDATREASTRSD
ncbi:MAG TPA: hypothetical protein VE758_01145 [Chthoniobacterales bacterium]|nr:hypothetical protein [Chthoniobacterales bacterium]